jgi:hypothetical protein
MMFNAGYRMGSMAHSVWQNAMRRTTEESRLDFPQGQEIYGFFTALRRALGPTQSPVHWLPWLPP